MAGYLKIWARLANEDWWSAMSATERGVWISLLLCCKNGGDVPQVCRRSVARLAQECRCDDATLARFLRKFADLGKVTFQNNEFGGITVGIPNYYKWQSLSGKNEFKKDTPKRRRYAADSAKNGTSLTQHNTTHNNTAQHNTVIAAFHACCPSLPKVLKVEGTRERNLEARLREQPDESWWVSYFQRVEQSDFLSGRKTDWRADFDWLLKPSNMTKIIEGKYDNRELPQVLTKNQEKLVRIMSAKLPEE